MTATTTDYMKLHFVVAIWSFTAILGLLITIPAVELVFYRTLFSTLLLGVILYISKRPAQVGYGSIIKMLGVGMIIAAHWIFFFAAARVSNASVALAGLSTCSLWTSFVEPLANKRKIKIYEVLLGMMVMSGLYVIFRFEFDHALGLTFSLIAAVLAAFFSVINSKFIKRDDPYVITFYEMMGACLGTMLFFPVYMLYFAENGTLNLMPTPMDVVYLLILASVCTVYAFSASVELMKRISAFVLNLTINLEPVYGIVLAVLFFGEKEKMGSGFYAGAAIILVSVLIYPAVNKYYNRKPLELDNLR